MADTRQGRECVPLTCVITLSFQECRYQFRSIGDQAFRVLVDRGNCKDGVLADVCMPMFEARTGGGKEGLDELGFTELA